MAQPIRQRFELLRDFLDERQRRLWAAAEAQALGRGGIARVAEATGLSRRTIRLGQRELQGSTQGEAEPLEQGRVRQRGGGRKPTTVLAPTLVEDLESLMMPAREGHADSPLRWTCDGTVKLADLLKQRGHSIGPRLVARLLRQLGYLLHASRMPATSGRSSHRETQFEYINAQVRAFHRRSQPVIAVTTSTRERATELDAENGSATSREAVSLVAPADEEAAAPDWSATHAEQDLTDFVVALVRFWWFHFGLSVFPAARELLLVADCAGTQGAIARLWKLSLQNLADEAALTIAVCHFPPGTSRWSQVDQRLGSLLDIEEGDRIVRLQATAAVIGEARSGTLLAQPEFERLRFQRMLRVQKARMPSLHLETAVFHGDWNYVLHSHEENSHEPARQERAFRHSPGGGP
jgi:hypothetical protein